MKIVATKRYKKELKIILEALLDQMDFQSAKNFKLYLDTIIINIPTKLHKYKISSFFNDQHVKEIDYSGFKIFIYEDIKQNYIVLLSIA
ncbi:MAG: hypothetical protein GXO11_04145 [Epsilonproteobacteria bacterium]|nr:hypothetical protein [Campylobacterota bacterium]